MSSFRVLLLALVLFIPAAAEGRFRVQFEASQRFAGARTLVQSDPAIFDIPRALNGFVKLPRDIPIIFRETGGLHAHYSPSQHHVVISYEFISSVPRSFDSPKYEYQLFHKTLGTLNFVLLHELAHALIHELDLPIVGREEDAADEFASLLARRVPKERSFEVARCAADWFGELSSTQAQNLPYWSEHSLHGQRRVDILAGLYSSDPQSFAFIEDLLPESRLSQARFSYVGRFVTWLRLLSPHLREPSHHKLHTVQTKGGRSGKFVIGSSQNGTLRKVVEFVNRRYRLGRNIELGSPSLPLPELPVSPGEREQLERSFRQFEGLTRMCRALIDEYDLPITGPKAEAAEDLAAILAARSADLRPMLSDVVKIQQHSMPDGTDMFQAEALIQQKLFNNLSYLYFADSRSYPDYPLCLPEDPRIWRRQVRKMRQVHRQKVAAWRVLLKPYRQPQSKGHYDW